jgi:hypothetical protein
MLRLGRFGALTAIAAGLGVLASASPAAASSPTFTTPVYGMTCYTDVTGGFGSYQGSATCYAPVVAKWKVHVDCSYGFSYDSIYVYTSDADGWYNLPVPNTCYWGVNSVQVIESR